ncbi:MAG: hypothetical protein J6F31_08710 [Oscillospiraceae bacterium]|nr:hypothetical protein [Oscillospiraceae bacterium]
MEFKEIFEGLVELFARSDLSPRINEEMNEIYIHAPLGKIYENADVFLRFAKEYFTVEAYVEAVYADEAEMLKLVNMFNFSTDSCTFVLDEKGVWCRTALSFEGATESLIKKAVYDPMYALNRFSPAIDGVCRGKDYRTAYEEAFV